MAVGYWKTLTEAQKLTESVLIPGTIDETFKRGNILFDLPVVQAKGQSIKWNRRKTSDTADWHAIGQQMTWTAQQEYTQMETELKRVGFQKVLDAFIADVYGTINNYEAVMVAEMRRDIVDTIGDYLVYGDKTYGADTSNEFDGLHALAADISSSGSANTALNVDEGGAFSLDNLRAMIDAMKYGCDVIYMPYCIARRIDAAYQERAFAGTAGDHVLSLVSYAPDEIGRRVMYFDGIPVKRTDYLVQEENDTGLTGTSLRAKYSSTGRYSVFGAKFGNVLAGDPGLCLAFGNTEMMGDFFKMELFDKLEDYDAGGIRLMSYVALLLGSELCLGRIVDITDAAITY